MTVIASSPKRFLPAFAMMLVSLVSYVDRNTLAILAPTIRAELRLTTEDYGLAISAFSIAYTIGNLVWGGLLDRFGVRVGMLAAVALWTLASASHAWVFGLVGLAVARAFLGFGEGATFPGGLRTVTETLPPEERSRGVALAYSGGSLGAIVTPLLVTPIAVAYGFRAAFLFTGVLGIAWLATWAIVGRNVPESPRGLREKLEAPSLRDRRLVAFLLVYALGAFPLALVLYAAPIYLNEVLHVSQVRLGRLLFVPPLGWEIGYFAWGYVVDRIRKRQGTIVSSIGPIVVGLSALGLPLAFVTATSSVGLVVFGLFFAMFVASGFVIVPLAYASECFTEKHSAYLAGVGAGSWALLVAFAMPLLGRSFDAKSYGQAFVVTALAPTIGAALFVLAAPGSRRNEEHAS